MPGPNGIVGLFIKGEGEPWSTDFRSMSPAHSSKSILKEFYKFSYQKIYIYLSTKKPNVLCQGLTPSIAILVTDALQKAGLK